MRSHERLTVPIMLNRTAPQPLQEQLVDGLRGAIEYGLLPAGDRLPSTRTLAQVLGISRGVAIAAYQRLYADGVVHGSPGSGTYVSERERGRSAIPAQRARPAAIDLRPGRAVTEGFPLAPWRSAWRQASYDPPPYDHPPARGLPELRAAVADHVRRTRGCRGTGHEVVITSGPRHALRVLHAVLGSPDVRLAVTDPGWAWWRTALAGAVPVPSDAGGIRVDRLPSAIGGVLVAPEGNVPMGVRTPPRRRSELAEWSALTGGWLVEIGCDAPTDPLAPPLPSLLTLGPRGRTALVGDLGELLTPAIGLGYLVLPRELAAAAAGLIAAAGERPALLCQRAAAGLLRSGIVARRSNQLAAIHARKIAMVRATLGAIAGVEVPDTPVLGSAIVLLPNDLPADRITRDCREAGLLLAPLHESYLQRQAAPNGLVLGGGYLADAVLRRALHTVARCIGRKAT